MTRQLDAQAWEEKLAYIEAIKQRGPKTLKEVYDAYGVTPEEDEAFKVKSDDRQVGGSHYKDLAVQPWVVMQELLTHEEFIGYLKGNIIKYAMRQGLKDSPDGEKCKHYVQKLRELTNES